MQTTECRRGRRVSDAPSPDGTNQRAAAGNGLSGYSGGTPCDVPGPSTSLRTRRNAHTRRCDRATQSSLPQHCTSGSRGNVPARSKHRGDFPRHFYHATSAAFAQTPAGIGAPGNDNRPIERSRPGHRCGQRHRVNVDSYSRGGTAGRIKGNPAGWEYDGGRLAGCRARPLRAGS